MTPYGAGRIMAWFTVMSSNKPVKGGDTGGLFSNDLFNLTGNPLPPTHDPYTCVYIVYRHMIFL